MKNQSTVLGIMGLLILLALWQIGSLILAQTMPLANMLAPAAALGSLKTLLLGGQLWEHIFASLQRVGVGLGFALLIGVPVGFALGLSRKTEQTASPHSILRMISPLSWMPVVVMLFGIGNAPIYFFVGVCGGVGDYFEHGGRREKHQPTMAGIGAFIERDPIGNVVENHAACRVGRHFERFAFGDWHCVGGTRAMRNVGRERRFGLFHFGHARPFGVCRTDGSDCVDWHHWLGFGQHGAVCSAVLATKLMFRQPETRIFH